MELLCQGTAFNRGYLELETDVGLKSRMRENRTYGSVRGSGQSLHVIILKGVSRLSTRLMNMENQRTIPQGYMIVSEVAKKMNTTVRTLQYYDKENILKPSGGREGGRRLYTHKDIVKLHQIQSMKYLGFSLEDIKTRLPSLNTPEKVANILSEQSKAIQEKINSLTDVLKSVEKLNMEVLQMNTVDWAKYADIIILLQTKNDQYWMMKHFDGKVLDHIRSFDEESAGAFVNAQKRAFDKVSELQKKGIDPKSEQGQAFANDFWDILMDFTKGDMSLLRELYKLSYKQEDSEWKSKQEFIEKAMEVYFTNFVHNPFEDESK